MWKTFRAVRPEKSWPRQLVYLEVVEGVRVKDGLILASSYGWWESLDAFREAYEKRGEELVTTNTKGNEVWR